MKKIFYLAAAALLCLSVSCTTEEYGTTAGNDANANVVLATFTPSLPYDADNDLIIRISANNATSEVYYLSELTTTKEGRNMDDDAYAEYVVSNGKKADVKESEFDGSLGADITIQGLKGDNTITAVAVGKNGKKATAATTFFGIDWKTLATGTYKYKNSFCKALIGASTSGVELQQRQDKPTVYRFKNAYGTANHLVFNTLDLTATDDGGKYTYFRVPAQSTGLVHSKYGAISVRDLGYWQGDDGYVTDYGYESGLYEDYNAFIFVQYYVSAGSCGYGYDSFVVD